MSQIRNKFKMNTKQAGRWRQNAGTKLYIYRSQIRRFINVLKKETLRLAKESRHISGRKGIRPCIRLLQTFKTTAEGVLTVYDSIDKILLISEYHIIITAFCNDNKTNYIT